MMVVFLFIALSLLVRPPCTVAQDVEIGALVINKTITRLGDDFYDEFTNRWDPPKQLGPMHISIQEAPSARWGTIIAVFVGSERYFVTRVSSRQVDIEEIAEAAVKQVTITLIRQHLLRIQNGENGDLVGDGL
ncbi:MULTISPECIES: CsgE family curli-type amyloid fiber assembly protein [Desulfosediminicola]|uniref:CsgE family curli-type amyloid fiber assembly protein n=1 Tax=Desulfosediminicola TaxID=2886823 RepID=UPI0010ACA84E|nr:CsgE family curli-type amyloid fiber assembly protein [Desulfosediminicola ganghwensis]